MSIDLAFKIGLRNITRNKKRTKITISAIAFVTVALVFFVSLQLSAYDTSIAVSTSVIHGNIQVQARDHLREGDIDLNFIEFDEAANKRIASLNGVLAITRRAEGFGLFSSSDRTYGAKLLGVDPLKEKEVSTIPNVIKKGRFVESGPEVVLGVHFANNLKVDVGSEINMIAQGQKGEVVAEVFKVVGIFESGLREIDTSLVEIPLEYFQEVFMLENGIHSLVIKTDRINGTELIAERIGEILSDLEDIKLEVHTWEHLVPGLKQMIQMDMAIGSVFHLTLLLVVGFCLVNTFTMSVLERKKEFGVMRALGSGVNNISLMIFVEGLTLTLIGIILGVGLGCLLVYYFNIVGFQIPGSEEISVRLNLQSTVYPWVTLRSLFIGPSLLFLMSIFSLIYPSREPKRIEPSEVLRT
jgi:putative ABC transport system permease protein